MDLMAAIIQTVLEANADVLGESSMIPALVCVSPHVWIVMYYTRRIIIPSSCGELFDRKELWKIWDSNNRW